MVIRNQTRSECYFRPNHRRSFGGKKRRSILTVQGPSSDIVLRDEHFCETFENPLEITVPHIDYKLAYEKTKRLVHKAIDKIKNFSLLAQGDCPCRHSFGLENYSSNTRFSDTFVQKVNEQNMDQYYCPRCNEVMKNLHKSCHNLGNDSLCPWYPDGHHSGYRSGCQGCCPGTSKSRHPYYRREKSPKCKCCGRRSKSRYRNNIIYCGQSSPDFIYKKPTLMEKIRKCCGNQNAYYCTNHPALQAVDFNTEGFFTAPGKNDYCDCKTHATISKPLDAETSDPNHPPLTPNRSQPTLGQYDDCCCCCPCRKACKPQIVQTEPTMTAQSVVNKTQDVQTEGYKRKCCRCCRNQCGVCAKHLAYRGAINKVPLMPPVGAYDFRRSPNSRRKVKTVICKCASTQHIPQEAGPSNFVSDLLNNYECLKQPLRPQNVYMFNKVKTPLLMDSILSTQIGKKSLHSNSSKDNELLIGNKEKSAFLDYRFRHPLNIGDFSSVDSIGRKSKKRLMNIMCDSILDGLCLKQSNEKLRSDFLSSPDSGFSEHKLSRRRFLDLHKDKKPKNRKVLNKFSKNVNDDNHLQSISGNNSSKKEMSVIEASKIVRNFLNDFIPSEDGSSSGHSDDFTKPMKKLLTELEKRHGNVKHVSRVKSDANVLHVSDESNDYDDNGNDKIKETEEITSRTSLDLHEYIIGTGFKDKDRSLLKILKSDQKKES